MCKNCLSFAILAVHARPSAGIGVVDVQKLFVFCDCCGARAALWGDRRGRFAKTVCLLRFLRRTRGPLRGSAWSMCKNCLSFAILAVHARPFVMARPMCKHCLSFCDSCGARAALCGDRRGRCARTVCLLRFLRCTRGLVRGSAWSMCKNCLSFAILAVHARPSAGLGVVDVQKLFVFCDSCGARAALCGDRRGRCAKTVCLSRFLRCTRGPLRGSAWSMCKNCLYFCDSCGARAALCGDRRGRCAKTEVFFCVFCGSRATICGDRRGRGAKTRVFSNCATLCVDRASDALAMVPCETSRFARDPLRGLCVSDRSRCGPVESSRTARDSGCTRPRSSGCKVLTPKYISSARSASPQLRLQSGNC